MDLKQLSYFVKIVEEGSISGAAKKLFMSQPPLSSQMKLLETELDCTLFERGSRTIHLTEAGETLYNYSRSLLQLSNVAKQETMNAARHFNGVLRIGIVSSLIGSDALGWLCGFSKQYPGIHYEINEADTYHLLSQFETNTIHLALLRTPFHTDSLTCKKLFTDSLVAVGQESFFADNRSSAITLDDLTKLPLIVYRRWEHLLRKEFEDKNLSANWFCINDDARTTLYFVEMGMGVGIIPQSAATLVQKKELYADRLKTAISQPMLSLHTIPLICRNAPAHLLSIWTPCTQIFHKPAPRISAFRLKISVIHFKICIRMFKLARIQMRQVDLLCKGQRLPVFKPALHIQMF